MQYIHIAVSIKHSKGCIPETNLDYHRKQTMNYININKPGQQ